jgi:hypothetical protein
VCTPKAVFLDRFPWPRERDGELKKHNPLKRSMTSAPPPITPVRHNGITQKLFSPKVPDWDYWKRLASWKLGEAVCLISKCDPDELESPLNPLNSNYYQNKRAKILRQNYELAKRSIEEGKLHSTTPYDADRYKKVDPKGFINWAVRKEISIPSELEDISKKPDTPDNMFDMVSGEEVTRIWKIDKHELRDLVLYGGLQPYRPDNREPLVEPNLINGIREAALTRANALGSDPNRMAKALLKFKFRIDDLKKIKEKYNFPKFNELTAESTALVICRPIKQRPSQKAKAECRKIALQLLKEKPKIMINDAIFDDRMSKAATKRNGYMYAEKTIRNWIKDLFPDEARSTGRRPKSPPKE